MRLQGKNSLIVLKEINVMASKKKKIVSISIALLIVLVTSSFISYRIFNVINPFSTAYGLIRVIFMEKDYVVIQRSPKVIVAKPNTSLQEYMKSLGFVEDEENRMGSLHRFYNDDSVQYVMYSTNMYFSKWIWQ